MPYVRERAAPSGVSKPLAEVHGGKFPSIALAGDLALIL